MWKNVGENEYVNHFISLHDCRATDAFVSGNRLVFVFGDGFYISSLDPRNPFDQTLKTDRSEIELDDFEESAVYVFKSFQKLRRLISRTFRHPISERRILLRLETLIANIHSGKWELEFIYEYHNTGAVLYQCWIWTKKRPYHMECQLELDCSGIEYRWNDLREDSPW